MKIIALPDIHSRGIQLLPEIGKQLSDVDLVLLPGDLTNSARAADAKLVVEAIKKYNNNILTVPGNWDYHGVEQYLQAENISIHRQHKVVDGMVFIGVGGSLPKIGGNVFPESQYASFLNEVVAKIDDSMPKVLVAHHPPYNTKTDITSRNKHVGSHSIRTFIEQNQPLICFSGHIHESIATDTIGQTRVINPGPIWKGHYAYAEIDDGAVTLLEIVKI